MLSKIFQVAALVATFAAAGMTAQSTGVSAHDSSMLDSIPFLSEQARHGEPWAYEALAECHRHGRGGVTRSVINAICNYELAGKNIRSYVAEIEKDDPADPIVIFSHIIDYLGTENHARIFAAIDTLHMAGYRSADVLAEYLRREESVPLEEVMEYIADSGTDTDAAAFACIGYSVRHTNDSTHTDMSSIATMMMDRIPYLYSLAGKKKYNGAVESDSIGGFSCIYSPQAITDRREAAVYFLKADRSGALSQEAARMLYHYCTCDSTSAWVGIHDADLLRIKRLADISE